MGIGRIGSGEVGENFVEGPEAAWNVTFQGLRFSKPSL